jgi:hypothetical protein
MDADETSIQRRKVCVLSGNILTSSQGDACDDAGMQTAKGLD